MLKKGIRYTVLPTLPSMKPDWLVQKHHGALPAIVHKDTVLTDPLAIAEYLEKTYPHSSLTRQGAYSYQEVLEKTAGFFPALTAYIKNQDVTRDAELGDAVEAQLDIIDAILRSTPGYYTCGVEMTLADLYLAPQLFHVRFYLPSITDVIDDSATNSIHVPSLTNKSFYIDVTPTTPLFFI